MFTSTGNAPIVPISAADAAAPGLRNLSRELSVVRSAGERSLDHYGRGACGVCNRPLAKGHRDCLWQFSNTPITSQVTRGRSRIGGSVPGRASCQNVHDDRRLPQAGGIGLEREYPDTAGPGGDPEPDRAHGSDHYAVVRAMADACPPPRQESRLSFVIAVAAFFVVVFTMTAPEKMLQTAEAGPAASATRQKAVPASEAQKTSPSPPIPPKPGRLRICATGEDLRFDTYREIILSASAVFTSDDNALKRPVTRRAALNLKTPRLWRRRKPCPLLRL